MKKIYTSLFLWAAKRWMKKYKPYVIGVTGSVGKTTCRMLLTQVLEKTTSGIRISTSPKNFNSDIGLVLAIFEIKSFSPVWWKSIPVLLQVLWRALFLKPAYDVIVLEYGIDTPGDMDVLTHVVAPHMSIFTGIDKVHAQYFEDIDQLLAEKMKLPQATKEIAFVPQQASYATHYLQDLDIDVLSYAQHHTDKADIGFSHYALHAHEETIVSEFITDQEGEHIQRCMSTALGQAEAGYSSLACEIAMILSRRLTACSYVLPEETLFIAGQVQVGRATFLPGQYGSTVIDSSYNAAPKSMQHMIDLAINLRQEVFPDHDLLYCLGDMRELGDFAVEEHKALAAKVAHSADAVYLIGEHMTQDLATELETLGYNMNQVKSFSDSRLLGKQVVADIAQRDRLSLILCKGSQNTIFLEEGVKQIIKDSSDTKKLPRQSSWRLKKKNDFFSSLAD